MYVKVIPFITFVSTSPRTERLMSDELPCRWSWQRDMGSRWNKKRALLLLRTFIYNHLDVNCVCVSIINYTFLHRFFLVAGWGMPLTDCLLLIWTSGYQSAEIENEEDGDRWWWSWWSRPTWDSKRNRFVTLLSLLGLRLLLNEEHDNKSGQSNLGGWPFEVGHKGPFKPTIDYM